MGGNWGTNVYETINLPPDYFQFIRNLNAEWAGISVALHVSDSMDSTVERKYSGVGIPTFTDEVLTKIIRAFRQNGFRVYLTLAFELSDAEKTPHPVSRWQLGDPNMPKEDLLWEDLGLDVVGISAYFQLAKLPPDTVSGLKMLESSWESIFQNVLVPLKNRNPNRPIVFLEFGYVDDVRSLFSPGAGEFDNRVFTEKMQMDWTTARKHRRISIRHGSMPWENFPES